MNKVTQWDPELTMDTDFLPSWAVEQAEELIKAGPYGNGRVNVGLAFDALFLPTEVVADLYKRVRQAGAKVITTHYVRNAVFGMFLSSIIHSFPWLTVTRPTFGDRCA
jgi:hypothetical protein